MKFTDSKFRESTSCHPFMYKNKKVGIESLYMIGADSDYNRLFLKVEIRRYSSHHLKCFIYCPFLIYNETEFDLFYKSRRNRSEGRGLLHKGRQE